MSGYGQESHIKPTDLRGILKYVPQWRGHVFIIALDGAVVEDENFTNLLLDLAVLRSLNIKLVLVLGISRQLERLGRERDVGLTDSRGEGEVDDATLRLAIEATGIVLHELMQGLAASGLRYALANVIRATEVGVLHGIDQQWRGKVDKIDVKLLQQMIDSDLLPLVPVIHYTRDGRSLRLNSDLLATELALALQASKLVFLTPFPGLTVNGHYTLNIPVTELRKILEERPQAVDEHVRSKAFHAVRAIEGGTPRVHIMDGRLSDGLLTEIFSKVGVGSMVYGNEYQQIRPARRRDVTAIYNITRNAVKAEALRHRTRQSIEKDIDHFFVYEIDESIIGCAALLPYGEIAELSSVYVQPFYQNKGVGRKLVNYALEEATRQGFRTVFALSTQSYVFFRALCGFVDGGPEDLPPSRREQLEKSGRNSRILLKKI